ncbi:MAG: hypothetical protein ACRDZQ_03935, partial [Acidimicrobiales bacterium]
MSGAVSPRARPGWWGVAAIVVLAAVPVAAMVVPTSMGSVPINGDNPVLGYPLRVLSGRLLAEGHLPLWDPYLWSGVPLLAGFNAGALFPATALFAVLPPVSAWVVTVILVYQVTAIGFYVFLRAAGRSVAAAFLGSLSFSFAGFMTSQFGHIDLVEAVALAPWLLLALHRLARPRSPRDRGWGWTLLLGACFALVILAGEPEAMLDLGVLAGVYALAMAWHQPGRGIRVLLLAALGVAGGVAVGAVQWLPGLALASHSQRAVTSYAYFGSGSLPPGLSALLVLPYLLGGYGRLGQIGYSGPYNLAELNGYVGILPVVAAFALFGRRARRPVDRGSWIWYLVIAVGLVLAMGSFTPLGHWLYQIPFYGQQRTQSRNLMDVDVGLAALLALWVDRLMDRRRAPAGAEDAGPAGLVSAAPAGAEDAGPAGLVSAAPA